MEQYVTGVDIGTGSTKAVSIDGSGHVIASSQVYYDTSRPKAGYSEQDPEIIWNAFVQCINDTIKVAGIEPSLISVSSAMHGLLLVDENHLPLTALITWEDTRSEKIAEEIRSSPIAENMYTVTGTPIHAMSPLCKIKWIKDNEPEIFNKARKFISIKEFIWYRLFTVYEVDQSIASATGLFNIITKKWNDPSLEICGITAPQLSNIVATSFTRKRINNSIAKALNIHDETIFCIGASDGCLANIGSGVLDKGLASVTIGTSGAVRITSAEPVVNYPAMIFNYILDDDLFICGAPVNNGGNVIRWLFRVFLQNDTPSGDDYKNLFNSVNQVDAGSNGLLFLPYLYGERAPVWDGEACGVFFGIKPFHGTAHFLRAALEGICYSLKNIIQIIEASSCHIHQMNVSGGFVHSDVWMHMLADVCNKEVCLARTEDASSVGAALLGMKATGMIDTYSSLQEKVQRTIPPDAANNALYEKYFTIFEQLYIPLKTSMHQLQHVAR